MAKRKEKLTEEEKKLKEERERMHKQLKEWANGDRKLYGEDGMKVSSSP